MNEKLLTKFDVLNLTNFLLVKVWCENRKSVKLYYAGSLGRWLLIECLGD